MPTAVPPIFPLLLFLLLMLQSQQIAAAGEGRLGAAQTAAEDFYRPQARFAVATRAARLRSALPEVYDVDLSAPVQGLLPRCVYGGRSAGEQRQRRHKRLRCLPSWLLLGADQVGERRIGDRGGDQMFYQGNLSADV